MDHEMEAMGMLHLMVRPSFCVKNQIITNCNAAAQSMLIREGMQIMPLLSIGESEYLEFSGGCLHLTLDIGGVPTGASVIRLGEYDVFTLDGETDQAQLQAYSLASMDLKKNLTGILATADRLFPVVSRQSDPDLQDQFARMNRGLYQMLRTLCNMSDVGSFSPTPYLEMLDIPGRLGEIFSKAQDTVAYAGYSLRFENLPHSLYSLANEEKLERAVMNMLSNAMKFTAPGGTIVARLNRQGTRLYLSVQDSGEGIPNEIRGTLYRRYLRQPGVEDPRYGIGLGMVLIRNAAAIHGGTVLIDHPEDTGTRITMTIAIRQDTSGNLRETRSPLAISDYAGERDHCLVEFSEVLPASLYESK